MLDNVLPVSFTPEDDGSGSGATQYSMNGLVDTLSGFKAGTNSVEDTLDFLVNWKPNKFISSPSTEALSSEVDIPERSVPVTSAGKSNLPDLNKKESLLDEDVNGWLKFIKTYLTQFNETAQQNAQAAMDFEAKEAQKLRDWQEQMSNTQYTRAFKELKELGVNPLLAIQYLQPASTPSGAMASGSVAQTPSYNYNSLFGSLLSSATALKGQNKAMASNFIQKIIQLIPMIISLFA